MNWSEVSQQDQTLRASVENASEALAKHRYDHTKAVGVSFREYSRQCGVSHAQVAVYVRAWEHCQAQPDTTISDALVIASVSAEKADAIQALAQAKGTSMKNVQLHHQDEVREMMGEEPGSPKRYLDMVALLVGAQRYLKRALRLDLETDPEMQQALAGYLHRVRELVALVELKTSDASDVDWDAELAQLGDDS